MSASQHMDGSSWSAQTNKDGSVTAACASASEGDSGKSFSTDSADSEEREDASTSTEPFTCDNTSALEEELSSFRREWQRELQISKDIEKSVAKVNKSENINSNFYQEEKETIEEKAKRWFLQGVENEKSGKLYEAVVSYKKAVQLVPDIEFKLCESQRLKNMEEITNAENPMEPSIEKPPPTTNEAENNEELEEAAGGEEEIDESDLVMKLQHQFNQTRVLCLPEADQKETHFSALPLEIVLFIFRWVVSHDLDLRSLEMCSMVCRGFYICSRDPEIWRAACVRVWGPACGGLFTPNWRDMFLGRPRLNFNGCYISKTTYIRHGENSFQDQLYRPWHVVEYFRYLRFFPEGLVLMLTTAEQPAPVVHLLKKREARNTSILTGRYRLHDDKVTVMLRRQDLVNSKYRGRRGNIPVDLVEQSFHIELRVMTTKNRLNSQLIWRAYTVFSKRGTTDTKTSFDVTSNKFPPFWFSRVKHYTAESDWPL